MASQGAAENMDGNDCAEPPCFNCNVFGCRISCALPGQLNPVLAPRPSREARSQRHQHSNVSFYAKKRRDTWANNALIFLYFVGGLLAGAATVAGVLVSN